MAAVFTPIAPRPAPIRTTGAVAWVRTNLFGNWVSVLATVGIGRPGRLAGAAARELGDRPRRGAPRRGRLPGRARHGRVLGRDRGEMALHHLRALSPSTSQWRPELATILLLGLLLVSCIRTFWKPWLIVLWIAVVPAFFLLMGGGHFGLANVPTDHWGGLPLTIMLATLGDRCSPSRSRSWWRSAGARGCRRSARLCIVYVELIRGVPLISVLFMASFMFPLFMPLGKSPDVLLRVLVGITLFAAAYLAEIVRGGLQAIPTGQVEAAATLGLSYWQTQRKIVLPQALAIVVPGIMNSFIAIFKDTSLVTIVSLYELTGSLDLALNSDANWRPFKIEGYLFIAAIYFTFCFAMSRYSLWVEKQLNASKQR